ncbi:MAG TPA: aldose 1-epimerase [Solirubrobacterales bacterium]|nr:aldose 1-epimerase [Solirubrobacterales bacterium]
MRAMVGERSEEGFAALTLEGDARGGLEAVFVPEAGMVCCSLKHRGEELLGQRGGLRAYVESHSTMGIPFLHPWANRLGADRFELAGRQVDLTLPDLPRKRDGAGQPIHGLLSAAPGWRVERHAELDTGGALAASFDFAAYPHLLEAFPFPHLVEIEATLVEGSLEIQTSLTATGAVAVPVSFGFHPYLVLPGVPRAEWVLEAPVRRRLVLDDRGLPTGEREPAAIATAALGARTYDDAFLAPSPGTPFALVGPDRRIELRLDSGYPFTQIYTPPDLDAVAIEPMTAPTDALLVAGPELTFVPPGETFTAGFSISVL